MPTDETLYVERDAASPEELQETLDAILAEITDGGSELAAEARAAGLAPGEVFTMTVNETGQGFGPLLVLAVVFAKAAGGGAGAWAARRVWDDVILPEIRRRRGGDAVGDVVEPE